MLDLKSEFCFIFSETCRILVLFLEKCKNGCRWGGSHPNWGGHQVADVLPTCYVMERNSPFPAEGPAADGIRVGVFLGACAGRPFLSSLVPAYRTHVVVAYGRVSLFPWGGGAPGASGWLGSGSPSWRVGVKGRGYRQGSGPSRGEVPRGFVGWPGGRLCEAPVAAVPSERGPGVLERRERLRARGGKSVTDLSPWCTASGVRSCGVEWAARIDRVELVQQKSVCVCVCVVWGGVV